MIPFAQLRLKAAALAGGLVLLVFAADAQQRYPGLDAPFERKPRPAAEQEQSPPTDLAGEDVFFQLEQEQAGELSMQQLKALESFLNMPPEQLAQVRVTIERIEAMSEEDKEAIRVKIREFRKLQGDKISRYRQALQSWKSIDPSDRHLIHRYMLSLDREEARAQRESMVADSETERQAKIEQLITLAKQADARGELPDMPTREEMRNRHQKRDEINGRPPAPPSK